MQDLLLVVDCAGGVSSRIDSYNGNTSLHHVSLGLFNHFSQFTALIHLNHDVGTTNKFTSYIQLGDCGPLRKDFDTLSNALVRQYINSFILQVE